MGIRSGARCSVWSITDKGTYAVADLSTSKKNKSGTYETDWRNKFCFLVDKAYENCKGIEIKENEYAFIRIGEGYEREYNGSTYHQAPFEVTNKYNKEKATLYTNYMIFDAVPEKTKTRKVEQEVSEPTPTEISIPEPTPKAEEKPTAPNDMLAGTVGLDFLSSLPFK